MVQTKKNWVNVYIIAYFLSFSGWSLLPFWKSIGEKICLLFTNLGQKYAYFPFFHPLSIIFIPLFGHIFGSNKKIYTPASVCCGFFERPLYTNFPTPKGTSLKKIKSNQLYKHLPNFSLFVPLFCCTRPIFPFIYLFCTAWPILPRPTIPTVEPLKKYKI